MKTLLTTLLLLDSIFSFTQIPKIEKTIYGMYGNCTENENAKYRLVINTPENTFFLSRYDEKSFSQAKDEDSEDYEYKWYIQLFGKLEVNNGEFYLVNTVHNIKIEIRQLDDYHIQLISKEYLIGNDIFSCSINYYSNGITQYSGGWLNCKKFGNWHYKDKTGKKTMMILYENDSIKYFEKY